MAFPIYMSGSGAEAFPSSDPEWSNVRFLFQPTGTNITTDTEKTGRTITYSEVSSNDEFTIDANAVSPSGYVMQGKRTTGGAYSWVTDAGSHCELGTDFTIEVGFNNSSLATTGGLFGLGGGSATNARFTIGANSDGRINCSFGAGSAFETDPYSNGSPVSINQNRYTIGDTSDSKTLHQRNASLIDHLAVISRDQFMSFYMNGYFVFGSRYTCTNNLVGDSAASFGIGAYTSDAIGINWWRDKVFYVRVTAAVRKKVWGLDAVPSAVYPLSS